MKRFYLILLVLLSTQLLNAQKNQGVKFNFNNAWKWTVNEKVKLNREALLKIMKNNPELKNKINSKWLKANEVVISADANPESELHATINPTDTNNIVVSPIKMDQNAGISCPVYYTKDFGQTWNVSDFVNMPHEDGTMSGGGGDPVFVYDANGRLYFSWIDLYANALTFLLGGDANMGIFWAYSDDGGATWTVPANDTILLGQLHFSGMQVDAISSPVSDKQWMAADINENSPYKNNIYISYVTLSQDANGYSHYEIFCKTKPADQDAFTTEALVADSTTFVFTQFSSIAVDANGNVHVDFYGYKKNDDNLALWHSVSTDGGQTFSTPNRISYVYFKLPLFTPDSLGPDTIPGINKSRLYPSPYMAADKEGNIYATWTAFGVETHGATLSDIYLSKSSDNGTTWSAPIKVNDDGLNTAHNYYSSITTNGLNEVVVSWYDRREDTDPLNPPYPAYYYYGLSTDGGQTFQNVKVSTVATDFAHVGDKNQGFGIGEYTQVLATDNYIIPVWSDCRTNDGDMNIYAAFINKNNPNAVTLTDLNNNVEVYPVPAKDIMTVEMSKPGNYFIKLVDLQGKVVYEGTFNGEEFKLNVNNILPGMYYVVVSTSNETVAIKSIEIAR